VIIAQYFWPEPIGSAPYCSDLAEWLAKNGHEVRVITSRPHYPAPGLYPQWHDGSRDREKYGNASVVRVKGNHRFGSGLFGRLANDLVFTIQALRKCMSKDLRETVGVVACFVPSVLALFPARWLARRAQASLVVIIHDIESGLASSLGIARLRPVIALMRFVERVAFSMATQIVVLSEAMGAEIVALGVTRPVSVLPIWTSVPDDEEDVEPRPFTAMYSGNFGKKQNLDQLIPVIEALHRDKAPIQFVMQGDGSERQRLQSRLLEMKLGNVEFRDLVPAVELVRSLRSADVHLVPQALKVAPYAIPSKVFGIMGAARPFIAVAEDGSPLHTLAIESGGGVCVRPGDDQAFMSALTRLSQDGSLRREMGRRGRDYVMRHMLREQVLQQYGALLARSVTAAAAGRS
jgi:colanic acid biosynthesis glycosyl transferase WcaI